jgi:hypothetical protein
VKAGTTSICRLADYSVSLKDRQQSSTSTRCSGEKWDELDEWECDLELCKVVLAEAQAHGLNPQDNHDELTEFVELRRCLRDIEVDRVINAD